MAQNARSTLSKWAWIALLVGVLSCGDLRAQEELHSDAESVLKAIMEANGGKDSIENVRSLRVLGRMEGLERKVSFSLLKKRPNLKKIIIMYKGRTLERSFDGETGWNRVVSEAGERVEIVGQGIEMEVAFEADFDGPLLGENLNLEEIRFVGTERLGRLEVYVLEVQRAREQKSRHYVDTRTMREVKTEFISLEAEEPVVVSESRFSNYTKVGGVWFAKTIERYSATGEFIERIEIDRIDLNPGIFDWSFAVPAGAGEGA